MIDWDVYLFIWSMINANNNIVLDDFDPDTNLIDIIMPDENLGSSYFTVDEFNAKVSGDEIVFVSYNIRSFNKNFDSFEAMLSSLSSCPDVICLSETWLSEEISLDGYYDFHTFRTNGRGGGVSIFCNEKCVVEKVTECNLCNNVIESCVVKLKINDSSYVIVGVYRPHQGTIPEFSDAITEIFSKFSPDDMVYIMGDVNINLLNLNERNVEYFSAIMR